MLSEDICSSKNNSIAKTIVMTRPTLPKTKWNKKIGFVEYYYRQLTKHTIKRTWRAPIHADASPP